MLRRISVLLLLGAPVNTETGDLYRKIKATGKEEGDLWEDETGHQFLQSGVTTAIEITSEEYDQLKWLDKEVRPAALGELRILRANQQARRLRSLMNPEAISMREAQDRAKKIAKMKRKKRREARRNRKRK